MRIHRSSLMFLIYHSSSQSISLPIYHIVYSFNCSLISLLEQLFCLHNDFIFLLFSSLFQTQLSFSQPCIHIMITTRSTQYTYHISSNLCLVSPSTSVVDFPPAACWQTVDHQLADCILTSLPPTSSSTTCFLSGPACSLSHGISIRPNVQ